jgi:hypothetical protein
MSQVKSFHYLMPIITVHIVKVILMFQKMNIKKTVKHLMLRLLVLIGLAGGDLKDQVI